MPDLHGIDVSHNNLLNQGPIDWNAVATTAPALQFVMARMTHGGHGDDDLRVDRQALNNRDGMRAAFPATARGYYHFLGTGSPDWRCSGRSAPCAATAWPCCSRSGCSCSRR